MNKSLTIKLKKKIELIQAYLSAINWTLGTNQLTVQELEVLSYFVYFDQQYLQINDADVRYELLFSTSVKKKIKEQFNINTTKLETYMNKLRKKGIIVNNQLSKQFQLNFNNEKIILAYNFSIATSTVATTTSAPQVQTQQPVESYPTYVEPQITDVPRQPLVIPSMDDFDDDYINNLPKFEEG
jgi:hypothetical protein